MSLDQNEIQELLALFPNGKHVIERFTQSQESIVALEKLDEKINLLKEEITKLKVKQSEERSKFLEKVANCVHVYPDDDVRYLELSIWSGDLATELYSGMDMFLAENNLSQLSADNLLNDDGTLLESKNETKRILLDAWNENLDDSEISILETKISDLQKLRAGLAVQ